jgi:signal transduction histidine kinase
MRQLGLRSRLMLAVSAAVTVALIGLVGGFNIILGNVLERNARDLVRTRALAQIDSLRIDQGRLSVAEAPDDRAADPYLWIFAGSRPLERPRVAAAIDRAARNLAAAPAGRGFVDVSGSDTRLYAAPAVAGGKRLGTVVAGVSLSPYEQTRKLALIASLVLGGVVLMLVVVAARWLLGASLRPVVRMTRQAAEWSEYDVGHRFALGPPHDELTELAATLDGLLDRLAVSLRHERRFSAELSHELRTPLARVRAESELALRRPREPDEYRQALELIQRNADQLARTIDALVAAARYEAGGARATADAEAVAEDAVRACSGLAAEQRMHLQISKPRQRLRVGIDADLAARILQPVLENACRYGATSVRVAIGRENSSIVYTIDDDGPGVADEEKARIFEPGVRGHAPRAGIEEGAGLGLSLARRLARSIEGDVTVDAAAGSGRFLVRLPRG